MVIKITWTLSRKIICLCTKPLKVVKINLMGIPIQNLSQLEKNNMLEMAVAIFLSKGKRVRDSRDKKWWTQLGLSMTRFQSFNILIMKTINIAIFTTVMGPESSTISAQIPNTMMFRGKTTKLQPIYSAIKPSMLGTKLLRSFSSISIRIDRLRTRNKSSKASLSIDIILLRNLHSWIWNFPSFRKKVMQLLFLRETISRGISGRD